MRLQPLKPLWPVADSGWERIGRTACARERTVERWVELAEYSQGGYSEYSQGRYSEYSNGGAAHTGSGGLSLRMQTMPRVPSAAAICANV